MIMPNYPVILPHRRSTIVSLETYPLCSFVMKVAWTVTTTSNSNRASDIFPDLELLR